MMYRNQRREERVVILTGDLQDVNTASSIVVEKAQIVFTICGVLCRVEVILKSWHLPTEKTLVFVSKFFDVDVQQQYAFEVRRSC